MDADVTVNTFRPVTIFGVNLVPYVDKADFARVQRKLQAIGNGFVRYPSGIADDVHWNGTGSFNAKGWWVPDDTRYSPGFQGFESCRGTTSHYGRPSLTTDGDLNTHWLSNANTDAPDAQWLYVDLGRPQTADAVAIAWGMPYATRFTVQYWKSTSINQWAPYSHTANDWVGTTASRVTGKGGTQRVSFQPVASRYFRILMTASSAMPAQYSIAELYVFNGATQLTSNKETMTQSKADQMYKPDQSWTVASSTDPACSKESVYSFDFESFMAYIKGLSPQVSPLITINCGGATPQEAAAWVHYANKVKEYGIKYWEIGNEMNGSWETGGPMSAREYARQYLAFYDAMKAEDPTIVIAGPGASDAAATSNDSDGKTFIQAFIDHLAEVRKAGCVEAVDFHWYPFFMNTDRARTWSTVAQLSALPARMEDWLVNHPKRSTVPLLLTEFNSGAGTPFSTSIENGLWLTDTIGEFIRGFGSRGSASYWTALHPADASFNLAGGDQSYFQLEKNPWQYQERPTYWAMMMMAAYWAIPGDASVHALVQASSDKAQLSVYANRRPDDILSLLVVNRDLARSYDAGMDIRHFVPNVEARRWTFDSSNYAWSTNSQPYHADPDKPPTLATETGVGPSFRHSFPPGSITVFQFTDRTTPLKPGKVAGAASSGSP